MKRCWVGPGMRPISPISNPQPICCSRENVMPQPANNAWPGRYRSSVGNHAKTLMVTGDRTWKRGLMGSTPSAPDPFTAIDLKYQK